MCGTSRAISTRSDTHPFGRDSRSLRSGGGAVDSPPSPDSTATHGDRPQPENDESPTRR